MHFDLSDLRLFIHVAESPSLTQAARHACLSTAAASTRIKSLEGQLECRLLYRDSRGVELTPAGHRLLHQARLVLRQVDHLKSEFGSRGGGHIRIFANTTAVTEFLPGILATFLAERPDVSVDLRERLTDDIVRGVQDGATDLGIVAGPINAAGLEALHFSTDRLVLVVPPGHALAQRRNVVFNDMLNDPHIGLQDGTTLMTFLRECFKAHGMRPPMRIQLSSFEAVCRMVESGVGIGVIPESAARRHQRTMALRILEIDEPWAVRERKMLVRDRTALPGCSQALIEALMQMQQAPVTLRNVS